MTLLVCRDARVAIDGVVALERFDLATTGARLALAGDVAPLFALWMGVPLGAATLARAASTDVATPEGLATLASGTMTLAGLDVESGAHAIAVGAAPLDPPVPLDMATIEYVTWSGRLKGAGRAAARSAQRALDVVGLGRAAKRSLATLSLPERRALVLAAAIVAEPRVLVAEGPLSDLDGPAALFVSAALEGAAEGRGLVVSIGRTTPGSPEGRLAAHVSDLAFFSRGELILAGSPPLVAASARLYGLTVRSNADALRAELASRGIALRGGPLRFSVELPEGKDTGDVLAAAATARSAVVELLSLM